VTAHRCARGHLSEMFLSRRIFFYLPNNGVKAGGGLRTLSGGITGTMASNASSAPVGNRGGRVSTSSPRYYPQKETLCLAKGNTLFIDPGNVCLAFGNTFFMGTAALGFKLPMSRVENYSTILSELISVNALPVRTNVSNTAIGSRGRNSCAASGYRRRLRTRPMAITPSARLTADCGTVMPSALALLRLMRSSPSTDCWCVYRKPKPARNSDEVRQG
jgi:hypothetical protein